WTCSSRSGSRRIGERAPAVFESNSNKVGRSRLLKTPAPSSRPGSDRSRQATNGHRAQKAFGLGRVGFCSWSSPLVHAAKQRTCARASLECYNRLALHLARILTSGTHH